MSEMNKAFDRIEDLIARHEITAAQAFSAMRQAAQSDLTAAKAEIEKAQAKASLFRRACEDLLDERPLEQALILRKQAEAIEDQAREWGEGEQCYSGRKPHKELISESNRLHQQAEAAEAGGDDDKP